MIAFNLSAFAGAGQQFFDNSGNVLSGGKIYTYEAGTTTPATTYTTSTGTVAHSNPIILDAAGRVPGGEIWLNIRNRYKFIVKTSTDVLLNTYDNISVIGYATNNITVSVLDFGAVGDGVTDNTAAFQAAFDYINSLGGGVVYIPPGRYRKADTAGSRWIMYSNTTLLGAGDSSVIFFDDKDTVARSGNDMLFFSNVQNIEFKDFRIEGTALTYLNETNQKQCLGGIFCDGFRMENVTIVGTRYMATSFGYIKNAIVTGCRLDYIVRDGIRLTNSENVIITNNTLRRVTDDCVALHSLDAATTPGSGFVVSNNTFEGCQGIKILGAKTVTISNNVFQRMLRTPINIRIPGSGTEGNTPQFSISITGNVFNDTFANRGTNNVISIVQQLGRATGGLSTQPSVNSTYFPYTYLNNLDSGTPVIIGQFGISITNNTIARTLGDTANYTSYGYGQIFDMSTPGFFDDPAVTSATFGGHGIYVVGPTTGLQICNNNISGSNQTYAAILLSSTTSTNVIDYADVLISGNVIFNFYGTGILVSGLGSGTNAKHIYIVNNIIDLDPLLLAPTHNADNTWASSGSCVGLNLSNSTNVIASGNVFKNMGTTNLGLTTVLTTHPNIVYSDYVASGDNAGNKGVRALPSASQQVIIKIDGDPTSATFGQIVSVPYQYATSMPTSGYYVRGAFVKQSNPPIVGSPGSEYIIYGWSRATTGNSHVLNTDWNELRCLTGT